MGFFDCGGVPLMSGTEFHVHGYPPSFVTLAGEQQNMRIPAALIAATVLVSMLPVHAQESKESRGPAVYKVEFDIREGSDGTTQPSQHYSMLIDESRKGVFQAGNRVPIAPGSPQYADVGVSIECTVHESDGKAALNGGIELTSITGQVNLSALSQPIIGQRRIAFNRIVKLGLPTVIVDDRNALPADHVSFNRTNTPTPGIPDKPLANATTRQVEATVTKVN
jgi:hypothetical protein